MLRRFLLVAALVGCSGSDAEDKASQRPPPNEPGLRLAICGTVQGFRLPSPDAEGVLALDDQSWVVATGASVRGVALLAPTNAVCVRATLDPERRIKDADIDAAPAEDPWARLPD